MFGSSKRSSAFWWTCTYSSVRKIGGANKTPPGSVEEAKEIVRKAEEAATSIIGTCPIGSLDMLMDRLREVMKEKEEFEGLERAAGRASRGYQKTRAEARRTNR